jgi:hypothetical protein
MLMYQKYLQLVVKNKYQLSTNKNKIQNILIYILIFPNNW